MHQGPSVTTYSCGMALRSCAASAEAEALGPRPPVGSRSRRVVPCLPRPRGRRCFRCELHAHRAPSRAAPRAQYGQAGPAGHAVCAQPLGFKQPSFSPLQPPAAAESRGPWEHAPGAACWHHAICRRRCLLAPRALSPPCCWCWWPQCRCRASATSHAARAEGTSPGTSPPDTGTACLRRVSRRPVARGERTRTLPQ